MSSLTDFILARIAADEERARGECEAKRRIVERAGLVIQSFADKKTWGDVNRRERSHARRTLQDLAAVYADHPDYREEWRP